MIIKRRRRNYLFKQALSGDINIEILMTETVHKTRQHMATEGKASGTNRSTTFLKKEMRFGTVLALINPRQCFKILTSDI